MKWPYHLIPNIIIALLLFYFNFVTSIPLLTIFILFSILIDIDHFFYFTIKYHNIKEIKKQWKYHYDNKIPGFFIFHSPEFNLLLLIFSFLYPILFLMLISNLIHMSLDVPSQNTKSKYIFFVKEWSIIYQLTK